jgi:SulP family sulfate permease
MGRFIMLLPYPVMSGWASGIGCTIILLQLAPLAGLPTVTHPMTALGELPVYAESFRGDALMLGLATVAVIAATPRSWSRRFPPALIVLLAGSLLAAVALPGVPTLGAIADGLPDWQLPRWDAADANNMLFSALSIALLGSIDSLLASLAADNAIHTLHDSDRELIGQGLGNVLAGFAGGIAGSGATVRTMANVDAGGRTWRSAVICALAMLAVVLLLGPLLAYIPGAILAGILIVIALDIIDWRYLRRIRTAPRPEVILMFTVMALTIVLNLIFAAAIGFVLASLMFVHRMANLELAGIHTVDNPAGEPGLAPGEAALLAELAGRTMLIRFAGPLSFGAANRMHRRMSGYQDYDCVILDLSDVPEIDSSAALALENIILNARRKDHAVVLAGLTTPVARTFARLGTLDLIREVIRCRTRREALEYAVSLFGARDHETGSSDQQPG